VRCQRASISQQSSGSTTAAAATATGEQEQQGLGLLEKQGLSFGSGMIMSGVMIVASRLRYCRQAPIPADSASEAATAAAQPAYSVAVQGLSSISFHHS
jgi:hypothetical protein